MRDEVKASIRRTINDAEPTNMHAVCLKERHDADTGVRQGVLRVRRSRRAR